MQSVMPEFPTTQAAENAAESHFQLYLAAVVCRLLRRLLALDDGGAGLFAAFPFLQNYATALLPPDPASTSPEDYWDALCLGFAQEHIAHLPLRALSDSLGLDALALQVLIAAGLVEEDIRFGSLFAALQAPVAARRPCVGTLGWLLAGTGSAPDVWAACKELFEHGLLVTENSADPRVEWLVRVPSPLWECIRGQPALRLSAQVTHYPADSFPHIGSLVVPDALKTQIERLPGLLENGQVRTLIVRGMTGSGRRTTIGAIGRELGADSLVVQVGTPVDETLRLLGPLATLTGALPILRAQPAPGETLDIPALPGYSGPIGITLGRTGGVRGPLIADAITLTLPPTDRVARRRLWQATGIMTLPADRDAIADHFVLNPGSIFRSANLAGSYAALDTRAHVVMADVRQAARALNHQALDTLATPLEPASGWDDLVVSAFVESELHLLESRCRNREVLHDLGGPAFRHNLNRGVRALFSGSSGTGKTLAARVLAAVLEKDIYRVDMAAVVSKYIGETERNLNQVLSRAEELDVILLLDEGDSLMSNRTDVSNANDRYANLETNYLLQRLESYEGIVIITTNAGNRIDQAFVRRIDMIIEFVPPEVAERLRLWQHHLPPGHTIGEGFLREVSVRCVLSGGQIRNSALHATLLAVEAAVPVGESHLAAALRREYRKAGATYPLRQP